MTTPRQMFELQSKPDDVAELDQDWEDQHKAATRCPGCNRWRADVPFQPIHARLVKRPRTLIATTGLFEVVARPVLDTLRPYLSDAVVGDAEVKVKGQNKVPAYEPADDWVTLHGAHHRLLEIDRGRYSRHSACPKCGDIISANGWSHPVIVERTLDDRLLYLGRSDQIIVDQRLLDATKILERFPTLRAYPIPVVPEPLDGEVLPGDAGWTGTLVRQRMPKPPDHPPEKGMGLWL